mmetsp:Transcript_7895/g.25244  ORF Transcript_7895/g.25244 Transcript_7895/m.25244 type:complete len:308 (+) Transcript_7895:101-1024(+)
MEGELEAVQRGCGAQVGLPLARRVVGAELVNLALGRHLERWLVRPAGGGRGRRDGDGARGRRPRRGPSGLGRVDRAGDEVLHEQHPGAPEQSREEQVQRVLELVLDGGGEDDGARRGGGMHHFELQHQRDGERGRKDLFEHRVQLERCDRQRRAHRERVASECVLRLAERRRRSRERRVARAPNEPTKSNAWSESQKPSSSHISALMMDVAFGRASAVYKYAGGGAGEPANGGEAGGEAEMSCAAGAGEHSSRRKTSQKARPPSPMKQPRKVERNDGGCAVFWPRASRLVSILEVRGGDCEAKGDNP